MCVILFNIFIIIISPVILWDFFSIGSLCLGIGFDIVFVVGNVLYFHVFCHGVLKGKVDEVSIRMIRGSGRM